MVCFPVEEGLDSAFWRWEDPCTSVQPHKRIVEGRQWHEQTATQPLNNKRKTEPQPFVLIQLSNRP